LVLVKANSYLALHDEIHFYHFCLLVIDEALFLIVREVAGLEAEGDIVEELAVLVLVGVEKESEIVEYVIEEVVDDDASLDVPGQSIDKLVFFADLLKPILVPVVLEVLVDLPVETVRQRPVFTESSDNCHPVMKLESLLCNARLVERSDNLNEPSHDEGEESHTSQHNYYHQELLVFRDGVEVAIANSGQGCDREVAATD